MTRLRGTGFRKCVRNLCVFAKHPALATIESPREEVDQRRDEARLESKDLRSFHTVVRPGIGEIDHRCGSGSGKLRGLCDLTSTAKDGKTNLGNHPQHPDPQVSQKDRTGFDLVL